MFAKNMCSLDRGYDTIDNMYEEEKIFGPLTFKQFLYVFGGAGLMYIIWEQAGGNIAIGGIIFIAIATLVLTLRSNPKMIKTEELAEYLQKKRLEMGENAYKKMLTGKIAGVRSQMAIRKERGLIPDKNLEDILKVLESENL